MPYLFLLLPLIKVLLLAGVTVRLILAMPDDPEKYGQAYMTFAAVLLMNCASIMSDAVVFFPLT